MGTNSLTLIARARACLARADLDGAELELKHLHAVIVEESQIA